MSAIAYRLASPRLVRAEILKLRRRRRLVATLLLLTVGTSVITYAILALLHATQPSQHGAAGGVENLGNALGLLSAFGGVAGVLVGTTAGAGDLGAGVFRELVVTGRSRTALFLARIPGGLAVVLSAVAAGYAIAAIASVALAGSLAAPSAGSLVAGGAWLLLSTAVFFVLGLGLASLIGSRTTPLAVLLAVQFVLTPILLSLSSMGAGRDVLPEAALRQLSPAAFDDSLRMPGLSMPTAIAVLVIAAWVAVSLGLGAWRTATRDA